jgi:hypothetical protein
MFFRETQGAVRDIVSSKKTDFLRQVDQDNRDERKIGLKKY